MQPSRSIDEASKKPPLGQLQMRTYLFLKRMTDMVVSFFLLLLLTPFMLVIMSIIYRKDGKPVMTTEQGFKKNNKTFDMMTFRVKSHPSEVIRRFPPKPVFRSKNKQFVMRFEHEKNIPPVMTSTGHWLTRYKLHKLPLLIHVLKGDMSLIGTKLPIIDIVQHCNMRSIKPLPIKQGIIGYSDTKRHPPNNDQQLAHYDLYYLERCSYWHDITILFRFITKRFRQSD